MNEKDKLILRLQNLKKSKSNQVTLDIEYLLNILQAGFVTEVRRVTPVEMFNKVDVDGGGFRDD
jgi:hypothetical protein